MGKHTIHDDPIIEKRIEKDMQYITARILDTCTDVKAIILAGGFGRGEGSVTFRNGIPRPMNDYDLMIITQSGHRNRETLEELSQSLAKTLEIDFVDLAVMSLGSLRKLPPTIFNFEMKYGSSVIYGPKSALDLIPNFKAEEIFPIDGMILLMNRMGDILGRHNPLLQNCKLSAKELEFISIPLHKALLACGDSLVRMHGQYNVSYQNRSATINELERLGKISFMSQAELDRIRFAYKEKLNPSQFVFDNPTAVLKEILPMYRKVFLRFADFTFKAQCTTIEQAVDFFMKSQKFTGLYFYKRFNALLRIHPKQWRVHWKKTGLSRRSLIYAPLPLLLFSSPWIKYNNVSSKLPLALDLVEYLQGQRPNGRNELEQWDNARKASFKMWKALFH